MAEHHGIRFVQTRPRNDERVETIKVYAEVERWHNNKLEVSLNTFRGREELSLREWIFNGNVWQPSHRGVRIRGHMLPALIDALTQAAADFDAEVPATQAGA